MNLPNRISIAGETYVPLVLRVEDVREDAPHTGKPSTLSVVYGDDVVELDTQNSQNVFHVVYARASAFAPERGY